MEAGAVACVEKPVRSEDVQISATCAHLIQTVKLMSEVKVVRRWPRLRSEAMPVGLPSLPRLKHPEKNVVEIIGIGASTGGPPVLQAILSRLPKDFPVPILIVQHIAAGFLSGLVDWLDQTTSLSIHVAAYGIQPLPGHVYLAPDDFHMKMRFGGQIVLSKENFQYGLRPSVAHLFQSLADIYQGRAVGVLLTGMGRDGAEELGLMKSRGAMTLAQDKESSTIYGMPGEAVALGSATYVLSPDKIAAALITLTNRQLSSKGDC
jgi:two-component system, chemotaxis family, protein-glutamate methylesterase/glutaminase